MTANSHEVQTVRLSILGMRCAGCIGSVESALSAVEGVQWVSVNFADHSALVQGTAQVDALKKAMQLAGFDAAVMEGFEDPSEQEAQETARYQLLMTKAKIAGSFGALLMLGEHMQWLPMMGMAHSRVFWTVIALITLAMMGYCGGHFYTGAYRSFRLRQYNMDTL
ncbi:MAG TPA: cation-transporting ATPase PacS, partial [Methylococcaceae bacterium]|nr:cation-transporting ATPase PacS [Methylococcaceae bacterium]